MIVTKAVETEGVEQLREVLVVFDYLIDKGLDDGEEEKLIRELKGI